MFTYNLKDFPQDVLMF